MGEELDAFFRGLVIPPLSETDKEELDLPITAGPVSVRFVKRICCNFI